MAFKEIELTEEEKAALGSDFYKFTAIGQKLVGKFVRTQAQSGQFAKAHLIDYVFKMKNEAGAVVEAVLNPPTDLGQKLKKAALKPGHAVMITYASDLDVGKESPMKIFKVLVDDSPAAGAAAKPPPPPPPSDDDLNF
jgi:hypothetical protein